MACGAPTVTTLTADSEATPDTSAEPTEPRPILPLPGSRVRLALPEGAERVAHGLRWRLPRGATLAVSDATVPPGEERSVVEAGIAAFGPTAEVQPMVVDGSEGAEVIVRGANEHTRALTVFRNGAIARVSIRHRPGDALLAVRILDSVRFDPAAALDPLAALRVRAEVEGLSLVPASNEQLFFRERPVPSAFPSTEAAVDVLFVPFEPGRRPTDDQRRGQLLGTRFAGLVLSGTEIHPREEGRLPGFEIITTTERNGEAIALYGAYLEEESGAWLLRASVEAERGPEWGARFRALAGSLGGDPRRAPSD